MAFRLWLTRAALAAMAIAILGAGLAQGDRIRSGDVRMSLTGRLSPRKLPRDRPAPVSAILTSRLSSADNKPLPRLRRIELVLHGRGLISTHGLPVCPRERLLNATSAEALVRCRGALVGRGRLEADVLVPHHPSLPTVARALAFNGRSHSGKLAVWVHVFSSRPPTAFVLPFLAHPDELGGATALVARVPRSLGPWPRLSGLQMKLGRRYSYRGAKRSYLNASCPVPPRFTVGFFPFARATFSFSGGRRISDTLVRSCRVRR
jgi:hypothetical protein